MYFDTHVNLHAEQFQADLPEVIARARAAGVTRMVTICDRLDRYPAVKAIAEANDDINCTVGVHPHYAKDYWSLQAETLVAEAATAIEAFRCVLDGIGDRLGEHQAMLTEALGQVQMIFVQVKQAHESHTPDA